MSSVFFEALGEKRRQHRADGPRVHASVGVAARLAVHRAHVETGATANAAQDLVTVARECGGSAVVDEHDVHLVRAVRLLEAEGLIQRVSPRSISIGDWKKLAEVGDFDSGYLHLREGEPALA